LTARGGTSRLLESGAAGTAKRAFLLISAVPPNSPLADDMSRKATVMTAQRCTCGFTEANPEGETIADHLLRAFTPEDDKGADGRVHLEGEPGLACLCGFRASVPAELDSHFLEIFIPASRVDSSGVEHKVIGEQTSGTPVSCNGPAW
jgi:hypothetical protein